MIIGKTDLRDFLNQEVKQVKGVYYPVKAGLIRRFMIRKMDCSRLHPNPDDEFCFPEIGPNMEIISRYEKEYRKADGNFSTLELMGSSAAEPLIIEKTAPEGYMILNGHHRWIAAMRAGMRPAMRVSAMLMATSATPPRKGSTALISLMPDTA